MSKKILPWIVPVSIWIYLIGFMFGSPVCAQRGKLNVLTYKYSKGDKYRINVSQYRTFSTTQEALNKASYGETIYDLYLECLDSDGDVIDVQANVEFTRITQDGKNLTYQLGSNMKQEPWVFAFDKFGRVLPESVKPASDEKNSGDSSWIKDFSMFLFQLPDIPVKIGDQWNAAKSDYADRYLKSINEKITITKTFTKGHYRLESIDGGIAMITLDVEISGSGKIRENDRAAMELEILIHMMGSYFFNIAAGKPVNGSITSELAAIGTHAGKEVSYSGTQNFNFDHDKAK